YVTPSDIDYVTDDSKYVIVGGETCAPTTQTECATSLARMALHRYTFINEVYHPTVLTNWATNNCYADFQKKLGYRLRLTAAKIQSSVEIGKGLSVSLDIINDGFAAPAKLRKLNLMMKNTTTNVVYTVPFQSTSADVRKWSSGSRTINETLTIPADVPVGTYSLSLALPDASISLASNAAYAIRLANTGTWDAASGSNNLNATITVTAATTPTTPTIVIDGATADWNNVDNIGLTGTASSIQKLKAFDDAANLYLLATGTLSTGYQLYIDADGKSYTGYQSWANGADYKIEGGILYRNEWKSSWVQILTLNASQLAKNDTVLEVSIPKTSLYGINLLKNSIGLAYRDLQSITVLGSLPSSGNMLSYNLLVQVTVPKPSINITVDGNASDWVYVDPTVTAPTSLIQLMKVYDDKQNIYILLNGGMTSVANNYDLFLNTDNSSRTGLVDNSKWSNMGADYAIISGVLYRHDSTTANGKNGFAWVTIGLTVNTKFDATDSTQEISIPKSFLNSLAVGAPITVGYLKLSNNVEVAQLPTSGGMATYLIETPYIPNLQSLVVSDDVTNLYITIQGGAIPTNYDAFINTDNNISTGYADPQFWAAMGAEYLIQNGILYRYSGTNQAWGWTAVSPNTVQIVNSQLNSNVSQLQFIIPRANFASLAAGNTIQVGFANAPPVVDKLPLGGALQSYVLTKNYIPALSNLVIADNGVTIFLTMQGSLITSTFNAFLNTDNNSATGFIDGTWSAMGADYLIQNGALYSYSGSNNTWGWTLVQAGLQVKDTLLTPDLKQRKVFIPRSKLSSLTIGNIIQGGYLNVLNGATAAAIPTTNSAMLSYMIAYAFVPDLQDIAVADNSTSIIVTVRGGNLSPTYQVYLNSDNVAASGYSDGTWAATGIDHLIENALLYSYQGTGNNWSWSFISGNVTVSNATAANGLTTRTITITKSALTNLAGVVKVGYRNLVNGSLAGTLPTGSNMLSFTLLPSPRNIGESGTLTLSQPDRSTWFTQTLSRSYNNPVVIISPLGYNDAAPAVMRVKNVTSNSFQYQIEEWDYLDGVHGAETVFYLVVEAGCYTLDGGVTMEAGATSLTNSWSQINFTDSISTIPLVMAQTMSYNFSTKVTTRIRWIGNSNMQMKVQEEEAIDNLPNHVRGTETVGYIALTKGAGNIGFPYETDGTNPTYGNIFKRIWFNGSYASSPSLLANMQTSYGRRATALRYNLLNSANFASLMQAEQSYETTADSAQEEVGYLALGGSGIFQGKAVAANGGSGARVVANAVDRPSQKSKNKDSDVIARFNYYPNPVEQYLKIESENSIKQLSIFNLNGGIIHIDNESSKTKNVDTDEWPKGLYLLKVLLDNGKSETVKIIK
ncbi:MAG: DUF4832 domain-containing protein, partial [Cyclobacteriaceae bacterium]|nr:DUF4832 domain-containing protein [Cyclobacteriaceae bacterium]